MASLHSTCYYDSCDCAVLNEDVLYHEARNAHSITILSAYYSTDFLRSLLSSMPLTVRKRCVVNCLFNGFAGQRLKEQREELEQLLDQLDNDLSVRNATIYLNTNTALFHSKVYRFEGRDGISWFVGSANASTAAFNDNEEVLLKISGHHSGLEEYTKRVIADSMDIAAIKDPTIDSLVKFWRTGIIYFKPNTQLQFTFNELNMPKWLTEKLSKAEDRPVYTDPSEPWGAYNIKRSMGIQKDSVKKTQIRIGSWSVETCFGYWVPSPYLKLVNSKIDKASETRLKEIESVVAKLKRYGEKNLVPKFQSYLDDIEKKVSKVFKEFEWRKGDRIIINCGSDGFYIGSISSIAKKKIYVRFDDGSKDSYPPASRKILGKGIGTRRKSAIPDLSKWSVQEFWRPKNDLLDRFVRYINRLMTKLEDPRQIERASKPLISTGMPEIWSDPVAHSDFSETFFDYLAFRWHSSAHPAAKTPAVIRSIQEVVGVEDGDDSMLIRARLERYLKDHGWSDDDWLDR